MSNIETGRAILFFSLPTNLYLSNAETKKFLLLF